ncbi:MAG: hypothetical protein J6E41_04420, partial [Lachnospiraceae bacterium]|nr:hypothetical protein [Lachnospiraceae bacterium]
ALKHSADRSPALKRSADRSPALKNIYGHIKTGNTPHLAGVPCFFIYLRISHFIAAKTDQSFV